MHLVEKKSEQYDIKLYFYIVFCTKNFMTWLKHLATVLLILGDSYHPLAVRGVKQPYFLDKSAFSLFYFFLLSSQKICAPCKTRHVSFNTS